MAATVVLTCRRPCADIPRIGTAAVSALPTVPVVGAGAKDAGARIGRPSATKFGAGTPGVVVLPLIGPATVLSRPRTDITGGRIPVPVGVGRWGRRGYATASRA